MDGRRDCDWDRNGGYLFKLGGGDMVLLYNFLYTSVIFYNKIPKFKTNFEIKTKMKEILFFHNKTFFCK